MPPAGNGPDLFPAADAAFAAGEQLADVALVTVDQHRAHECYGQGDLGLAEQPPADGGCRRRRQQRGQ